MTTKHRGLLQTLEELERSAARLRAQLNEDRDGRDGRDSEESLAARHRYQVLFEASRDGALVVDKNSRTIVDANHAMGTLMGLASRLLVERSCESLFTKESVDAVRTLLIPKTDDLPLVMSVLRADGQTRHVEATSTNVHLEGRECVHVLLRDVTDREKLLAEREGLLVALHQAHKLEALGHLAGGVSHDMNNVLSVVLSCARALKEEVKGREQQEDIEQILVAASRGRDLVLQLLAFARKEPERRESFDLCDAVREATNLCSRLLPQSVKLKVDLPPSPELVVGDRSQMVQAILNLCVNARDAMADHGLLTVSASAEEKRMTIRVQDTGSGMTPEVQRRAFEPFFTTKPNGEGTGLGLSMVYTAIRAHGGDVRLESEVGKGTRFTFWLPKEVVDAPPLAQHPSKRMGRALIVDDDENVGRVLGHSLRSLGFDVDIALSGDEAVSKMQNGPAPRVAVCDLIMPGIDGTETMRRLRMVDPGLPVIIASGFLESAEGERVLREGATDVLSKPFTIDDLRRVMTKVLEL